jgi:hypothetical protein
LYPGCTDVNACNFDPSAGCAINNTCIYSGCTNPSACNFDSLAGCDDGSCIVIPNAMCSNATPYIIGGGNVSAPVSSTCGTELSCFESLHPGAWFSFVATQDLLMIGANTTLGNASPPLISLYSECGGEAIA